MTSQIIPLLGVASPGYTPEPLRTITVNATFEGEQTPVYKEAVILDSMSSREALVQFPLRDGKHSSRTFSASAIDDPDKNRVIMLYGSSPEDQAVVSKSLKITSDLNILLDLSETGGGIVDYPLLTGIGKLSGFFDLSSLPESVNYSQISIVANYRDPQEGVYNGLQAGKTTCEIDGSWVIEGLNEAHRYNVVISIPTFNDITYSNKETSDSTYVPEGDLYWDKVVSLLHFDGDLTDEINNTWEMRNLNQGSATFSTVNPLFGIASLSIDNPSGNNVHAPFISDLLTTGDIVTIECFIQAGNDVLVKTQIIFGQFFNIGSGGQDLYLDNGKLTYQRGQNVPGGEGAIYVSGEEVVPIDVWIHIAFVFNGSHIIAYMGGREQLRITTTKGWVSTPTTLFIIGDNDLGSYNSSYRSASKIKIDELRITKGVARYSENFTPPTKPFPNYLPK